MTSRELMGQIDLSSFVKNLKEGKNNKVICEFN